jgi:O-antigen/teichoic acid export membrane protein
VAALILPLETYFEEMRGLLRAQRLNRQWAFFTLARQMPETLFLIALAVLWTASPVRLAVGYLVTAALSCLLGYTYIARKQQIGLTKPSLAVIAKYVPYGLALVPGALAASLSFSADRYLVGYYLDLRQVGIYSVCFTVSASGFFFVAPLNDVLLPEMARLHDAGDWDHFYKRFSGVQKLVVGVAMGATALLASFPQEILRVFTTREFAAGAPTLTVLGLQGVFMSIVTLYAVVLCVRLRVWWATVVWAVMGLIILGCDVLLLPRLGIVGAAIAQLISSGAGAGVLVGLNWEIFRRSFRLLWIPQTMAAAAGVWLLASSMQAPVSSSGQALARIALGSAVFLVGLVVMRYVRVGELLELHRSVVRAKLQVENAASGA